MRRRTWACDVLSVVLSILLCTSLFPTNLAFAADAVTNQPAATEAPKDSESDAITKKDDDSAAPAEALSTSPFADASANDADVATANSSSTNEANKSNGFAATTEASSTPSDDVASTPAAPMLEATASEETDQAASAPAENSLDEVWLSTKGDDANDGSAVDKAVKELATAIRLVKDGGTIHTSGKYTVSDLSFDKNVYFQGTDAFLTVTGTMTAVGKSITMTGYTTALTIDTGAKLGDGTYTFDKVNTGIQLNGIIEGSSREALHVTVNANKNQVGINTKGTDVKYRNASIVWNGGHQDGWTYRSLYMENCSFYVKDVWLFNSPDNPFNISNSDITIEGRFGHVISIYEDAATINNSNVTVVGSRVNVINAKGLSINDSTFTIKDSPDGGFNVNYGSSLFVNNSTIKGINVSGALIVSGFSSKSNLYVSGSSRIETSAATTADSVGADGTYVVTGGTFKIYPGGLSNSEAIPTNGDEHGNEKLTLFTLADSSITSLKLVDKNGQTYDYPVEKANDDGTKNVWAPKATVTYTLNNINAKFADGTNEDKIFVAMRGMKINDTAGFVDVKGKNIQNDFKDPGTPVDSNGVKFLGWVYKDASGKEQIYEPSKTLVTTNLQVYAKWDAKTVVYNNGAGIKHVVNLTPGETTAKVLSFDDIATQVKDFSRPGKSFKAWSLSADGTKTVSTGDILSFDNDQTQIDLYAQYTDILYSVKFSANGGQFSDGSVFKNSNYFTIEKDAEGGEVAVLNKKAAYGQTLHELTESLGLNYADKSDSYLEVDSNATLDGYELADSENWMTSQIGGSQIRFDSYKLWGLLNIDGKNPSITSNTTYFLTWKSGASPDNTVSRKDLPIQSDMWGDSRDNSSETSLVRTGDTFSLTGTVNTQGIKDQMTEIEKQFGQAQPDFSQIKLSHARSTFNVELTLPSGVKIPAKPDVKVDGLGDLFEVSDTSVAGQKVTITMTLKDGIDNYQKLRDAVWSTGTKIDSNTFAPVNLLRSLFKAQASQDLSNKITATVSGLTLDDTVTNGDILIAKGKVTGHFEATASTSGISKFFSFDWKGVQTADGKDPNAKDSDAIQYSFEVVKPYNSTLPADILVGSDTEHDQTYKTLPGEKIDFTGALNIKSILEQMKAIEGKTSTGETTYPEITLKDTEYTFVATFTIPDGMSLPKDVIATASDFGHSFYIEDTKVEGSKVTVTMKLKTAGIANYKHLKEAVEATGDSNGWMHVTIPNVQISPDVQAGTKLTVAGTVDGSMKATATLNSQTKHFEFNWSGSQWAEGADALTPDTNEITFTCEVPSVVEQKLPADMLVKASNTTDAASTEHDQVFTTEPGASLDYTGAVKIDGIKEQMKGIEALFNNPKPESIKASIPEGGFGFTATITLPEGVSVPSNLKASDIKTDHFSDTFVVTNATVDGQNVTVDFGLNPKKQVDTYKDLKDLVDDAGLTGDAANDWISITIPGVKVSNDVENGTNLTAVGKVAGYFKAIATSESGKRQAFSFVWNGIQWPEGRDAIQAEDSEAIQLTINPVFKPITVDLPSIQKKLAGDTAPETQFGFELSTDDSDNTPMPVAEDGTQNNKALITGAGQASFGSVAFAKPGTYTYKVRELNGNASGFKYDTSVYTVTYVVALKDGELQATPSITKDGKQVTTDKLEFTNAYTKPAVEPITVASPSVRKTISGDKPATDATFTFKFSAMANKSTLSEATTQMPMPATAKAGATSLTADIKGAGVHEFGDITFSAPGTYVYEVSEVAGTDKAYTYDKAVYTVSYKVVEKDGKLIAERTITKSGSAEPLEIAELTFENQYKAPKEPVTPKTPTTNPSTPEPPKPTDDTNGTTPKPSVKPTPKNTAKTVVPKLGDTFNPAAAAGILLAGVALIGGAIYFRRRQNKNDHKA